MLYGIYGASGFGREVMPLARRILSNNQSSSTENFLFVDDGSHLSEINGYRVVAFDEFLALDCDEKRICIAIADGKVRQLLSEKCADHAIEMVNLVSLNATIGDNCTLGPGSILCDYVSLTSNIEIGQAFQANLYSYVAHDCVIGDYVTFAPNVHCNGNVHIGDGAYLGTGAILRQGTPDKPLVIGEGAIVGMGAVVTKDVPPGVTVVGNPAAPMNR